MKNADGMDDGICQNLLIVRSVLRERDEMREKKTMMLEITVSTAITRASVLYPRSIGYRDNNRSSLFGDKTRSCRGIVAGTMRLRPIGAILEVILEV